MNNRDSQPLRVFNPNRLSNLTQITHANEISSQTSTSESSLKLSDIYNSCNTDSAECASDESSHTSKRTNIKRPIPNKLSVPYKTSDKLDGMFSEDESEQSKAHISESFANLILDDEDSAERAIEESSEDDLDYTEEFAKPALIRSNKCFYGKKANATSSTALTSTNPIQKEVIGVVVAGSIPGCYPKPKNEKQTVHITF